MAVRVVTVDRDAKRSWARRWVVPRGVLPSLLFDLPRALGVAAGRFVGRPAVVGEAVGEADGTTHAIASGLSRRGMPVLVEDADGRPRCTSCQACAVACPASCIEVVGSPRATGPVEPAGLAEATDSAATLDLASFRLDMARCVGCGSCEEVCPELALVMSDVVEIAVFEPGDLVYEKEQLLVPEALVAARLESVARVRRLPGDTG